MKGGILALALAAWLVPAPAGASGTIACLALDGTEVTVEINVGLAAVERPGWIRIGLGEALWTSLASDLEQAVNARPVAIAQSFIDARTLLIDVADDNMEEVIASVRVLRVEEGRDLHQIGYLHLTGRSVHPITCEGP